MRIPIESLAKETVLRVIEEFVTREGTDYGVSSADLSSKVQQVLRQLQRGEAALVFDSETESCHIVGKDHPALREARARKDATHAGENQVTEL